MFSVVIPIYNKAPYIDKAIQSVLCQTFMGFELIIVDDGSTDESMVVLENSLATIQAERNSQKFDILIIKQQNQGVSAARNNGVSHAKYEYIAFLDGDDWWAPTYLEEMCKLITKYPSSRVFGSNYYKVTNGINQLAKVGVDPYFSDGPINYLKVFAKTMYMPLWTGATVVNTHLFRSENGFNKTLKAGEDFELWLRLIQRSPVVFLNKPLAYYNQDVDVKNRAVGSKLYQPSEHVIFYDFGNMNNNTEFRTLFEILAVYALLPYYLSGKFENEVNDVISTINWSNHSFKYRLYYKILPKFLVKFLLSFIEFCSGLKKRLETF